MKIGLTYTGWEDKHRNYVRWLEGSGTNYPGLVVVRLSAEENNGTEIEECDALVLTGGVDVHPAFYGGSFSYAQSPGKGWEIVRDKFERSLLGRALERKIPVLGICRGLQLINVYCGGTLVQDLGEEGDATHQNRGEEDRAHGVEVEKDSQLYNIAGDGGTVDSAHHQAIDRLGFGLRVNSHAVDGTIEGIEWREPAGRSNLLAVQWHPERMFTHKMKDDKFYAAIRSWLMEGILKFKKSGQ